MEKEAADISLVAWGHAQQGKFIRGSAFFFQQRQQQRALFSPTMQARPLALLASPVRGRGWLPQLLPQPEARKGREIRYPSESSLLFRWHN